MYPCDRKLTKKVLFKLFLFVIIFLDYYAETGKERKQSEATYDLFTDHMRHEI